MQPPRQSTKRGLLIESNSGITDQQLNELIHQTEQITDHYDLDKDYFARLRHFNESVIYSFVLVEGNICDSHCRSDV
ncbi:hypothetical protein QR98_0061030 [Sarcoptes scabiei]|uniref:Uncharacterized protein n=1 Tax=Sarcoptes scabiei TaxID=52283 RepID=A0A132A9F3_SARSC|nr:hypothetical protein QR98_0061030 [Sarcoptes scabiei]